MSPQKVSPFVPPPFQHCLLLNLLLELFVMVLAETRSPSLVNFKASYAHAFSGERSNCFLVTSNDTTFGTLGNTTQQESPPFVNSRLHKFLFIDLSGSHIDFFLFSKN